MLNFDLIFRLKILYFPTSISWCMSKEKSTLPAFGRWNAECTTPNYRFHKWHQVPVHINDRYLPWPGRIWSHHVESLEEYSKLSRKKWKVQYCGSLNSPCSIFELSFFVYSKLCLLHASFCPFTNKHFMDAGFLMTEVSREACKSNVEMKERIFGGAVALRVWFGLVCFN